MHMRFILGDMNGVDGESSEGATSVAGAQEIKPGTVFAVAHFL